MNLKENYIIANCCKPRPDDIIIGYYSFDNLIKVHKSGCHNLDKADPERLVELNWNDILAHDDFSPDNDYDTLEEIDFIILKHHKQYGVDYSLKVASMYHLDKQAVFKSHTKLRSMNLLKRVEPLMMQYRKNIVKNRWIKHRNHTYYELTDKGTNYLKFYQNSIE